MALGVQGWGAENRFGVEYMLRQRDLLILLFGCSYVPGSLLVGLCMDVTLQGVVRVLLDKFAGFKGQQNHNLRAIVHAIDIYFNETRGIRANAT